MNLLQFEYRIEAKNVGQKNLTFKDLVDVGFLLLCDSQEKNEQGILLIRQYQERITLIIVLRWNEARRIEAELKSRTYNKITDNACALEAIIRLTSYESDQLLDRISRNQRRFIIRH